MIRPANGGLEPIKFTRLSNHFQTREGRAAEELCAVRLPQQRERKAREGMAPLHEGTLTI